MNGDLSKEESLRGPITTICLVVAVDISGFMMLIPILDVFAQSLGASKSMIGLQITLYSIAAVISSFLVGKVSDYYGRKTIFIISAIGSFISSFGCIFITNFTEFLVFSAFSGFFSGTIGTAYAYVGDIVHDENQRSKYIAYITATISLCLVLGPLFGGLISSVWTLRAPFYISSFIALVEFIFVIKYLKNPQELLEEKENLLLSSAANDGTDWKDGDSIDGDAPIRTEEEKEYQRSTSFSEIVMPKPLSFPDTSTNETANEDTNQEKDEEVTVQINPMMSNKDNNKYRTISADENGNTNQVTSLKSVSPWLDYRAILIGGVATFLNVCTYLGLVTIMPLVLQEHSFGIVDSNDDTTTLPTIFHWVLRSVQSSANGDDDDLTSSEASRISFLMGLYLSAYGITQVLGMVFLFPRLQKRCGLLVIGSIGCFIYGISYCALVFIDTYEMVFLVYIVMALGNSVSRPVFPSYLGSIASKKNRADYMAISATFANIGIMIAGQMTVLYTIDKDATILLCGGLSVLNAVNLIVFYFFHQSKADNQPRDSQICSVKDQPKPQAA
jgi:MFS family permease